MNRKNVRSVFIVGFQRGGTALLYNILRSHPGLCSPRGELHELFVGKRDGLKFQESPRILFDKLRNLTSWLVSERHFPFSAADWSERQPVSSSGSKLLDSILYDEKIKATGLTQNMYKKKGKPYSSKEVEQSRLLCKVMSGMIFFVRNLFLTFPDAYFVGIVRNGLALAEGHKRRGTYPLLFAEQYERSCQEIQRLKKEIKNYKLVRYEDMIDDPRTVINDVYSFCELEINEVDHFRMIEKKVINEQGKHEISQPQSGLINWVPAAELESFFVPNANTHQIQRLTDEEIEDIKKVAGKSLNHFGYL